ncbi:MAG: bifunctional acetaldehyde-CoA/alcohol dehydrogenase [Peptococcaceae bacterium]|jgi:acetaldehyde dehydrogenase/alcohol dehydrogenase|nr:bifunctional acetaldehyde-CoA/alcohol dehydrogenase [Peptococcaceae bacterium]
MENNKHNPNMDLIMEQAQQALEQYMQMTQAQIDEIVREMALAGLENQLYLAQLAVEETGMGIVEDKVTKNIFATEYIYHSIKYEKTVGVIESNEYENYEEIAEPVGIIAGITPTTNPTSTTMFKSIISAKTRNPIVFAFHPRSQKSSVEAARIMREAAIKAGAPQYCIQWLEEPSIDKTHALMNHPQISLILATGGTSMVKTAYSSGKPAIGVGPGNVPCYIEKTADIKTAVNDIIISKTFDNGLICASEQAVIVDKEVAQEVENYMQELNCYFLSPEQISQLEKVLFDPEKGHLSPSVVGKSAFTIAKMAGLEVDPATKILIAELEGVGPQYPLSAEKLSPVLAFYKVENAKQGIELADKIVRYGGLGHSAVIHSRNKDIIDRFAQAIKTGRLIVNSPSTHGAIGDLYNTNIPSLTLGCGSFGSNSTTANITAVNLINKKRLARRTVNMQWFKIPDRIYFEYGSIKYLEKIPRISKAFIVTDQVMLQKGYVDRVLYYLRRRMDYVHSEIFAEVEADPSLETVQKGLAMMQTFQPDVIIALGGGSPIDAAKAMWMFYEHPEIKFEALTFKFMDIRKRIYKIPQIAPKAKFVAVPTTSGTGSEVTSFAVISDKQKNIKYPIADYELTPDVAIIDPEFTLTVPSSVTADTGLDVLTHALEAYVSVMASDFTDALALKAIQLVFNYLPRAFSDGKDREAREKMHNASCMAGMAFTNAFLGVNHALAHKLGGEFNISHGRANAILLPHVIRYNSEVPAKITVFPKYKYYIAPQKYAQIAAALNLNFQNQREGIEQLIQAIQSLMEKLQLPLRVSQTGINKDDYEARIPKLAQEAFQDQTITTNPRMPLIHELENLYRLAY